MDWTGCEFVERVEGKMSGAPVVVGTRVPPETFVEGMAAGMSLEELHEDFPTVSLEQIKCILGFAQRKQFAALKFCINEQVPIRSRPLIDQSRVH